MARRNREINIFSMSALDLFASAMGAFILIAVAALPYYLKTDRSLMEDIQELQAALEQAQQQMQQAQQQLAQAQADMQQMQSEMEQMKSELENAIQFALLGISTKATSFVVVVDMSGSMDQYIAIMESTLGQLIEPMDDRNQLQIIGFNGDHGLIYWEPHKQTSTMSDANKSRARRFISGLSARFGGSTPTEDALLAALQYDVDAVILLTDGSPDGAPADIVRNVTQTNANNKEIHTVAVGDYDQNPALVSFLQKLASSNNGGFLGISR